MMWRRDVRIYVATEPVNMSLSFDRLAGIVRDQLGGEPREIPGSLDGFARGPAALAFVSITSVDARPSILTKSGHPLSPVQSFAASSRASMAFAASWWWWNRTHRMSKTREATTGFWWYRQVAAAASRC
ncbi:MAG: hypothetical protein R3B72_51360 [Polyangiaceae bacterium]